MSSVATNEVWLGQIPSDWRRSRIRNVATLSPNYSRARPAADELCTVVPMELLSEDGFIDQSNQQPLKEVTSGLTLFEKGDVLFAKITPCMENGKGAFVRELPTGYAFGSTEFHVLRPSKKINGQFLYYATFNPVYRAYAAENMVGAAGQKRVSSRFVKDTRLFLPPLLEQQRIAAFLGASCAAIDAAVSAKRRQLETLDLVKGSIIETAITRGADARAKLRQINQDWIDLLPVHWTATRIKRVVSRVDYGISVSTEQEGKYPVLKMGNIQSGELGFSNMEFVDDVIDALLLESNDLLYNRTNSPDQVGKAALFRGSRRMAKKKKIPELTFQQHIADYLVHEHKYGVLEQSDITDTEHFIAEDQFWAFVKATQADTLKKLEADYGTDAREEVFKALRKELERTPVWMLFRQGLKVRGLEFRLFYPKPRSAASAATAKYGENRITFRPHFYFGELNHEIDFVFYLNGLPIVAMELKHEANQNVHDAVAQFTKRDHTRKIFQHPFLYLAADTSDVKAATDPRKEQNFRWHNMGLTNTPTNKGQYPVEFLYRKVLSQEQLLEALSFFLVRVLERLAEDDKPERPASTIFPRYHQSRLVRRVAEDITAHFDATGDIGKKYLADHSAGSGKTLSICWLADRLHSLYKPSTNEKLVDISFILTDRKSLDTNIREDIEKFTHLKDVVGIAKKADDLPRFLQERKSIIVTTQQKFAWVLEEIQKNPELKKLRVAFLIDEAHRSQEGHMGAAIRLPFRKEGEPDVEAPDEDDVEAQIARVIREHDLNQLFVAFTATPSPATVSLFGTPFDTYTEAEAIAEGYIVDVAASIISYKTLYNLHCPIVPKPDEEKLYPKGVVSKALQNVAFQDDGLIQYKAEVMLRIFEKDVKPLIGGRAKAMIVTSSRVAGLRYFNIIKEKLKERGADYKCFSPSPISSIRRRTKRLANMP
jgi:SWI2/SNF2 ATPase/Type I restriction modification DNA specificity domain/Type I restriction enzyme R protein N terminus (HSDR_N)